MNLITAVQESIAAKRRSVNDSWLGQQINRSIPGVLVEGVSRGLTDLTRFAIREVGYSLNLTLISRSVANNPNYLSMNIPISDKDAITKANQFKEEDKARTQKKDRNSKLAYSHTSLLLDHLEYPGTRNGSSQIARIPFKEALEQSVKETSVKTLRFANLYPTL